MTPLPPAPLRSAPASFASDAEIFLSALAPFATEANALQSDVNAKQTTASAAATNAQAAQAAAEAASNASIWVSGTTYAVGAVRFSPSNFLSYRRKTAGAGTTDPASDTTNWVLLTGQGNVITSQLQAIYPVGSIYINAGVVTNPNTLIGFGTWVEFGAGRVLVGQNTSDSSFDSLQETGGSKDAIVVAHSHTFSGTTSTVGNHQHGNGGATFGAGGGGAYSAGSGTGSLTGLAGEHAHTYSGTTVSAGSAATNANLPPYIVVKMWLRTA
jgi:hypothetical protein